jgi:hypothetical protein
LNCLRRPFQGRALPVSYLGTGTINDFTENRGERKGKTKPEKRSESANSERPCNAAQSEKERPIEDYLAAA